jgi:hypothetical protein
MPQAMANSKAVEASSYDYDLADDDEAASPAPAPKAKVGGAQGSLAAGP